MGRESRGVLVWWCFLCAALHGASDGPGLTAGGIVSAAARMASEAEREAPVVVGIGIAHRAAVEMPFEMSGPAVCLARAAVRKTALDRK